MSQRGSQRQPDSHCCGRNKFNKGSVKISPLRYSQLIDSQLTFLFSCLRPKVTTQQQPKEQTTLPGSSYALNSADVERRQRRKVDLLHSTAYFGQSQLNPLKQATATMKQRVSNAQMGAGEEGTSNFSCGSRYFIDEPVVEVPPNVIFKQCNHQHVSSSEAGSETGEQTDSSYDPEESQSLIDSESDFEKDVRGSIQNLRKGLEKITSKYLREMKVKFDEEVLKLKQHKKEKRKSKSVPRPNAGNTNIPQTQTDPLLKKIELEKRNCYKRIEASLNQLKNIDNLTFQLHHNHISLNGAN